MHSQILFAALAGGALVGWLALFLAVERITRVRVVGDPAAPADEFEADPAIAALLCPPHRRVPRSAATAVLWDLVARGVITAWLDRDGQCWVRPGADDPTLTEYERHVLRHVSSRAVIGSGVAPAAALSLPPGDIERKWRNEFARLVIGAARERGLVAAQAPLAVRVLLGLLLLVPVYFAGGTWRAAGVFSMLVLAAAAGTVPLSWMGSVLSRPVPRGHGRAVAAQCVALRARLSTGPRSAPPAPGDRLAAYAVALAGAHPGALSVTTARRDTGWSSRGGEWRPVRIRPARRSTVTGAPGPVMLVLTGLGAVVLFGGWLVAMGLLTRTVVPERLGWIWPPIALAAGWLLWGAGLWRAAGSLYREAYDARHPPRVIIGPVVHIEYVEDSESPSLAIAVDGGTGDEIPLYRVNPALYPRIGYGSQVRLELMPRTGRALRVELMPAAVTT